MRMLALAVAVSIVNSASAAMKEEKSTALSHVAKVHAFAQRCPGLVPDNGRIVKLLSADGIDLSSEERQKQLTQASLHEMMTILEKTDRDVCAAGEFLYGLSGKSVTGLLVRR